MSRRDVFLLTKPPGNCRAELCLCMLLHSENAVLYLAGDGVYNLIDTASLEVLQSVPVIACKEDAAARGIDVGNKADMPDNFYGLIAGEMISDDKLYIF